MYSYKYNSIIKYENFSLSDLLNCIYERFKINIYNFINKYKIDIKVLYYLIYLIKKINERNNNKAVILYETNYINTLFYKDIYLYIRNIKYDKFYKYLYKIYNSNYRHIFKMILKTDKKYKVNNNDHYSNVKDIINMEYNLNNNHYYTTSNIFNIKIKDINIKRQLFPKLICYTPLKMTPEKRKEKKKMQKFSIKYNKLLKINKEIMNFIDNNLKTDFYKSKAKEIIYEYMYLLDKRIQNGNNNINIIRDTYKILYSELCNSWYGFYPEDDEEIHDNRIVNDIKTWKMYASHEDDDYNILTFEFLNFDLLLHNILKMEGSHCANLP